MIEFESNGAPVTRASRRRVVFLTVSAVAAVAIMIAAHEVMLPFVLAVVIAYVLSPAVARFEKRMPRWVAILAVYAITLGAIGGFIGMIVPRLIAEGQGLATEWPRLRAAARDRYIPAIDAKLSKWTGQAPDAEAAKELAKDQEELHEKEKERAPITVTKRDDGGFDVRFDERVQFRPGKDGAWRIEQPDEAKGISSLKLVQSAFDKGLAYAKENSLELLKIGRAVISAITRGIFVLFITLMLAAYIMLTREKIMAFFRELWGPHALAFDRFVRRLDRGLSGVVRGQLFICLVNGVLSAIGFWIFGLKYWPILSILAAVMSLIPIFGSILSSIPAVLIGLTQSPAIAFGVLAWIVGIHQIEANFLNPKIIGDSAKIHPVLVVFSLIVGEHFFQITGALFAVPCMSIAQTVFLHFRESTMGLSDPTASIPPPGRASTFARAAAASAASAALARAAADDAAVDTASSPAARTPLSPELAPPPLAPVTATTNEPGAKGPDTARTGAG